MMMIEDKAKEKRWWLEEAEKLGYTIYSKERGRQYREEPKYPPFRWEFRAED